MYVNIEHIIAMIIVLVIIILLVFFAYRIFLERLLEEKTQQHQQELAHQKEVALQYTIVQENERKRIAEMLHDDVGNKLNILSLWITNEDTWNDERSKKIITQQVPDLIESTRTISHSLYPVNLEKHGLILAIEGLITSVSQALSIQLLIKQNYQQKPVSFELQIYRIIQECISNVIKHAKASAILIYIRETKGVLSFIISDDGVGFDVTKPHKGMGLTNITTRLRAINAHFKWKSSNSDGTRIIIGVGKNE